MGSSKIKAILDVETAKRANLPLGDVKVITQAFMEVAADYLVHHGEVYLDELGRMKLFKTRVDRRLKLTKGHGYKKGTREQMSLDVFFNLRVFFSKSAKLKKRLEKTYGKARRC